MIVEARIIFQDFLKIPACGCQDLETHMRGTRTISVDSLITPETLEYDPAGQGRHARAPAMLEYVRYTTNAVDIELMTITHRKLTSIHS